MQLPRLVAPRCLRPTWGFSREPYGKFSTGEDLSVNSSRLTVELMRCPGDLHAFTERVEPIAWARALTSLTKQTKEQGSYLLSCPENLLFNLFST